MKRVNYFFIFVLFVQLIILLPSCKDDVLNPVKITLGTYSDSRDGRVYKTTTIGDYTWLAENLDFATDSGSCYYDNDSVTSKDYGRLYTWQAAQLAVLPGWHLPTSEELKYLDENLGGETSAGCQMKEVGNLHWVITNYSNNSCATNYSGLTIIPGGFYSSDSIKFFYKGGRAEFWDNKKYFWFVSNDYYNFGYTHYYNNYTPVVSQGIRFSVRCVKDY